jgi:DNA-binding CsgD family transcriptional regulator
LTPFGLIPAETRVLERLLRDMSLVAAAAALGIAETTAKTHLSRIFAKTGVSRQPELVALVHTSCRHCGASNPGGEGLRWNCATRL